jgi:urea transport system substrate-binding protein
VRVALESGVSFDGPGGKITMQANHHATKNVYIGETMANGQFKIVKDFPQVPGEPFLLKALDEKLAAK